MRLDTQPGGFAAASEAAKRLATFKTQTVLGRARAWASATLTTIGAACRAVLRETLGKTSAWAIEQATLDGWRPNRIKTHLALC
jgi:hypothetical protein